MSAIKMGPFRNSVPTLTHLYPAAHGIYSNLTKQARSLTFLDLRSPHSTKWQTLSIIYPLLGR
ncbi:MAG: hypothetical protein WAL51_08415, partial [Candidatus Acidiferrales bacterium]